MQYSTNWAKMPCYCASGVHYCKDHFPIHFFIRRSHMWFSYIHCHLLGTLWAILQKCQLLLILFHVIWCQGYNAWTQGLYGYSWDMMVHSWSTQHVRVKVVDQVSGEVTYIRPSVRIPVLKSYYNFDHL